MRRQAKRAAAAIVATALLSWPAASSAAAAPRGMTTVEIRDQFAQCGFAIENPQAPARSPYIVLEDPGAGSLRGADYRIVMAIVYADTAAAFAAHQKAHRLAEDRLGIRHPFSDNHGPQLLGGYGGSVWRANVAMVQSSSATLASMYSYDVQTDESRIARPDLFELGFASSTAEYGVDRDFVSCLEDSPLADNPPLPTSIAPVYLPGQPW